jgi:hypothetical protein
MHDVHRRRNGAVGRKIDAENVIWLAPETLHREELAERLAKVSDPQEIQEILAETQTWEGEYRELKGEEVVDGPDGTTVIAPVFGARVVWVDDTPDDRTDNTGHFERYTGDVAAYSPRTVKS